jgi:glyoxylase-like metal-dependent hydrolase (beta-lactamase superfamily II)
MQIKKFTFNPFAENTYVVWDDTSECVIIDPGCYESSEEQELAAFIKENKLQPVTLLNTHCHIDHVLGNAFVAEQYNLKPQIHPSENTLLEAVNNYAPVYGIQYKKSPDADLSLADHGEFKFGNTIFKMILAPGHSPGSICFYNEKHKVLIGGDVLFLESIGRTDLPGGHHETLLQSIRERIFTLPEDVVVYPGHMDNTSIGHEKKHNPFF